MNNEDKPELPILTFEEALLSFSLRFFIMLLELITCLVVIAGVIHHW